jgi:hypothetical protein
MSNTEYTVTINMDPNTCTALYNSGYYLYGFKAVISSDKAGCPLLWFRMDSTKFGQNTYIEWSNQYQAYTSSDPISADKKIRVGNYVNIGIGQEWRIGETDASKSKLPGTISIRNSTGKQLTCGISEECDVTGKIAPVCAFPLYGDNLATITPSEKILLMFATKRIEPGTAIEQFSRGGMSIQDAFSPGILVDLTGSSERNLVFNINWGWNYEETWTKMVEPDSSLVPLLIE